MIVIEQYVRWWLQVQVLTRLIEEGKLVLMAVCGVCGKVMEPDEADKHRC